MTEGQALQVRTASFRPSRQGTVAALRQPPPTPRQPPGDRSPSAAAGPERPPARASARPTSGSLRTPPAPWKDVVEPDILPGQPLPQIATESGGYAQSLAPDAGGLNVAPDTTGKTTAEWLDQVAPGTRDSVTDDEAGNLTGLKDEVFRRSAQGGTALGATDVRSVPAGPVFALKTTSGGALVLYTTAAQLTLAAPGGTATGGLTIPGYYPPASPAGLTPAAPGDAEQFATYIPPSGNDAQDVAADISSIASRGQPGRKPQQATDGFHCASQAEPRPAATGQQASRPQTHATCQAPRGGSRPGLKTGIPNGGRR